jgi:hypothetical protein
MPSATIKGITTIVWGTDNGVATPAGAIIESLKVTPKNGAPIEIEDNNGFAAVLVLLPDGFNAQASCVYDKAKVWPQVGANVVVNVPNTAAANANNVAYTCLVGSDPEIDQARKREAHISLNLVYRPGVAV